MLKAYRIVGVNALGEHHMLTRPLTIQELAQILPAWRKSWHGYKTYIVAVQS
jgi:hypothetical protein